MEAHGVSDRTFTYTYEGDLMNVIGIYIAQSVSVTYLDLWCP